MPFQGPGWAGHPATATFQAARVLYEDLSCLLTDGIEPCRTNGEAWFELAFATDLLMNDDMRLLIVLKGIKAELISRFHLYPPQSPQILEGGHVHNTVLRTFPHGG
jgi:hypothetical protein